MDIKSRTQTAINGSIKNQKTVLFMGYTCNNKCIFCCNENKRNIIRDKSFQEIKQDIIESRKQGSNYVELIGGEPTIRKDIFKIISFAKKLGFETIMFATNGRMLSNKEFVKKIIDKGINHIVFSIHGHTSELHDELTQVPGSFEQLTQGIKNLQEIGFNDIGSNTTIVKQNYQNLLDIGKLIYNLGIRNSEFIFVDPTHGAPKDKFDELVPTYEEASPYINELLNFGKIKNAIHWDIRYYPLCYIEQKFFNQISELKERRLFHTVHIAPDFVNQDAIDSRRKVGRMKIEKCTGCKHDELCEGYWREYVKLRRLK